MAKKESKGKVEIWKRKDGIIVAEMSGTHNEKTAQDYVDKMTMLGATEKPVKILVNATNSHTLANSKTRRIHAGFVKKMKLQRAAVFGCNIITKTIINFILAAVASSSTIDRIKIFSSKEQALKWLKEESDVQCH